MYHFTAARMEIVKHYKWMNVGLIYSSDVFHTQVLYLFLDFFYILQG